MIGKWKIKHVAKFDPECGFKKLTMDDILALPDEEEREELLDMCNVVLEITETSFRILQPIPAEEIEEAKAEGIEVTDDGFVVAQNSQVKVENGVYYYNSADEGEIMDEEIDGWEELRCNEDGDLELNPMMTFERIKVD